MAQKRILEQALPVMTELDRLIFQMETSLGKKHTVSPFQQYFPKQVVAPAAPAKDAAPAAKEEKKAAPAKKAKADKPKQEGKPQAAAAAEGENAGAKKGKGKGNKEGGKKGGAKPAAAADPLANLPEELKAFAQCDVRVGKIVECERHPESEKLYIEKIDLGEPEGRIRTIVSGLQPFVTLEEMLEDKIIVFANMKPRKLAGIMSEGMVLCASNADHTVVELMRPHNESAIGERVTLEGNLFGDDGLTQEAQPILNPKRKIEPKLLDKLVTDGDRLGLFDGKKMVTAAGTIVAKSLANASIQ